MKLFQNKEINKVPRVMTGEHMYVHMYVLYIRTYATLCGLVGCFGFNGPLRQYFSLYRAVFQREGERKEKR